jgi:hypothetical protein
MLDFHHRCSSGRAFRAPTFSRKGRREKLPQGEVKALWFSRERISDPSLTRFLAGRNRIGQKDVHEGGEPAVFEPWRCCPSPLP